MSSSLQMCTMLRKVLLLQQAGFCVFKVPPTTCATTWPKPEQVLPWTHLVPYNHFLLQPLHTVAVAAAAAASAPTITSLENFIFSWNGRQVPHHYLVNVAVSTGPCPELDLTNHPFFQNLPCIFLNQECNTSTSLILSVYKSQLTQAAKCTICNQS